MTAVLEPITKILIEDPDHDPDTCCFCNKGKPDERENVFDADPDEDDRAHLTPLEWVKFKNHAETLGDNLIQKKFPKKVYWLVAHPKIKGAYVTGKSTSPEVKGVTCAAHHLIPGNAALKESRLFKDGYLGTTGKKTLNIGYNINKAPNGIWAPGNYAMRPWGPGGINFDGSAYGYAKAAIEEAHVQFHDAHPAYSKEVLKALEAIADKVDSNEQICPFAAKQDKKTRVLVTLVARLDSLSERCRRMVSFPSDRWKLKMFLSRFSSDFMTKQKLGE